jgi:hypothetical protein
MQQRLAHKDFAIIKLGGITTKEGQEANISAKDPGKGFYIFLSNPII